MPVGYGINTKNFQGLAATVFEGSQAAAKVAEAGAGRPVFTGSHLQIQGKTRPFLLAFDAWTARFEPYFLGF